MKFFNINPRLLLCPSKFNEKKRINKRQYELKKTELSMCSWLEDIRSFQESTSTL